MSGILDLLNSDLGKQIVSGVSGSTGQDESKTGAVLTMAMPLLMKAMQRNASSTEGARSLENALEKKHNGGILDNLGSLFQGGVDDDVKQDGGNILNHILGAKQTGVEQLISQKSGLDASSVANILKIAAPLVMGYLGKQKKEKNVSGQNDLTSMLGGLLNGNSASADQSFLEKMLDADGDGSVVDDVAGMFLGGNKKKSGLGGVMGGRFGK